MKKMINESAESLKVMTEVQEEKVQGGLQSALKEDYGVVAAANKEEVESGSHAPWTITF